VHNTFSGSVTVTDNWSVDVGVSFGIPKLLGVDVHTTVEHGKEVTMSQTIDYNVPPQLRVRIHAFFELVFQEANANTGVGCTRRDCKFQRYIWEHEYGLW
jgi:hypothetical protein